MMKTMFYFPNTRKPDFRNIKSIDYNLYWKERGFALNKKLKEREEIILGLIPSDSKVLDIGCGNSLLPVALKKQGSEVSVADISVEVLKGYSKFDIGGVVLDLEKINQFENNLEHYDYIILSEVLEHTKNPEEIINVLSSHTDNFLLTIPNSAFYRYRFHLMFFGRFFTQWVYHPSEHLRYWSHSDFLDWIKAMNLDLVKSESSNGFTLFGILPVLKNLWPNMFGHQIVYFCRVKKN